MSKRVNCVMGLVIGIVMASECFAENSTTVIVLHAVPHSAGNSCWTPQGSGFDCVNQQAGVTVAPQTDLDIYVYTYRADSLTGIAVRFDWDASWILESWQHCPSGWISAMEPTQSGESLVAAFNCSVVPNPGTPALIPIGKLRITSGGPGTFLTLGAAFGPDGTAVVDCVNRTTPIASSQWGSVGVNTPGVNGCAITPSGGWDQGESMF